MDNPRFVDEETIMLVQDKDFDDYNTPDTKRVDETSFTGPDVQEASIWTLKLRQKVKQDKLTALCKHLSVTGDPGLADMDQFMLEKNPKTGNTNLLFFDDKHWQSVINKGTGEILAPTH